jgi:hypothetical protein
LIGDKRKVELFVFQPSERSERGPIEDWGIIPATGLHLASVSEKQK